MIVHHTHSLQVGITDGAAKKFEAKGFHILTNTLRQIGGYWNLILIYPTVYHGAVVDKATKIFGKTTSLCLNFQETLRVVYCTFNF